MVQVAPNLYGRYVKVNKRIRQSSTQAPLKRDLEGNGFVLNPYNPCVVNKMINGAQMTVC